ncbi:MAG: hypothetical protein ACE14T_06270 [Syntrophales bacterium]
MKHTFLFQEAVWIAQGWYYNPEGEAVALEGKTVITHLKDLWLNEGRMKLLSPNPVDLVNQYKIIPFQEGGFTTTWESYNPALGILLGNFFIIGDSIISTCVSQKGTYTGTEFLIQLNDHSYLNRGVFLEEQKIVSSWSVELKKS